MSVLARWRRTLVARARQAAVAGRYDRPYGEARALLLARRHAAALEAFEARVAERPISYSARLGVALCLQALGRLEKARAAFAELTLDLDAGAISLAYEHLGAREVDLDDWVRELMQQGDKRRALALSRLLPHFKADYRAWCLHELGRDAQALALVRRGRVGGELAAEILMATGLVDDAAAVFDELARGPRTSWYHRAGDERKVAGIVGAARVALRRGDLTRAVRYADRALDIDKRSAIAVLVAAAALHELGLDERARRALQRLARAHALEHFRVDHIEQRQLERRLGVSSARRDALDGADAAFVARRFGEAAALYSRALSRGPKTLAPRALAASTRWAYALAAVGDRVTAGEVAQWVASIDGDNLTAWEIGCWSLGGDTGEEERADSQQLFRRCGLGVRLDSMGPRAERLSWRDFVAMPATRALRHARASALARGTQLAHFGHWREALEVFEGCTLPDDAEARFIAAHAASNLGDQPLAWQMLAPLLAARRDVSYYAQPLDPWLLALETLQALQQPVDALAVYSQLSDIWRSEDDPQRAPLLARARRCAASACESLGQRERAAALRAEADRLAPAVDQAARARELHSRGFEHDARGDIDAAVAVYARALEHDAAAADVAGNAANLLTHRGDLALAYSFFAHGRLCFGELAPPLRRGWFLAKLAWCAYRSRSYRAGAALARRAAILTRSAGDWHTVALCERAAGQDAAAREALGRALAEDPRLPQLHALTGALGWPPNWSGLADESSEDNL